MHTLFHDHFIRKPMVQKPLSLPAPTILHTPEEPPLAFMTNTSSAQNATQNWENSISTLLNASLEERVTALSIKDRLEVKLTTRLTLTLF